MNKKDDYTYVEPKSYFSPGMRRAALEYDRDHNVDTGEKLTPEMQLRLIDWLDKKGINEKESWEALDYMIFGDQS